MAPKVEIYTWRTCPFCIRAKALLKQKGVKFTEYAIDGDEVARAKMANRANVGGCDDIHELDALGQLDPLLAN
jgi:glutaredoxin 3